MRNIMKNPEPQSLAEWRKTPEKDFDGMDKSELWHSLYNEQGHLCCYCMGRLNPEKFGRIDPKKRRIEHWQSKSDFPQRIFEYSNLMLACDGGGDGCKDPHCDRSKGERRIKFNPSDPHHNVESRLVYKKDGSIECPGDPEFQEQIDHILRLNLDLLKKNRKAVRDGIACYLGRRGGAVSKETLQRLAEKWRGRDESGGFRAYCQVAIFYLEKRLIKR